MKLPFFNIAFLALITTFSAHGAVTEKTLEAEARKEGMLQITTNKLLYADVPWKHSASVTLGWR